MIDILIKRTPTIVFLFIAHFSVGQNDVWESWDNNYKEIDITALLKREQKYADSIDNDPNAEKFYLRQDGYRFKGTFTGQWRDLSADRRAVMKFNYKLFTGESEIFDQTTKEVQIMIDDQIIWMPIQPVLVKPFKKEIKKNRDTYLYTVFFNQHKMDGSLYNIFFISEFKKM
jgi:hypothetical protein